MRRAATHPPAHSRRPTHYRRCAPARAGVDVHVDTRIRTYENRLVATRVKRTYNLAPRTVKRVREMAERHRVAPSQDAVIELAVDELDRRLRDERETAAWEEAASDPGFVAEAEEVMAAYRSADRETWPA